MKSRLGRPAADECSPYYFTYINLVPDGDIVRMLQTQHAEISDLLAGMTESQRYDQPDARCVERQAGGAASERRRAPVLLPGAVVRARRAGGAARHGARAVGGDHRLNSRDLADLLAEFAHVRAASVSFFANLDEAAWERRGSASGNLISVRALAWIIAGHELHHNRSLRQEYL